MLMKARLTKLFTLLTILTLGITNVWGDVVISLQGTTSAASKKAAQIGSLDAYFGRCGNAVSLSSNGLTTGNSSIFVAFKVPEKSEIVLTCYCTASSNYTKEEYLSTITWSNITAMSTTEVNSTPAKAYFETDYETFNVTYNKDTQRNKEYEISLGEYAAGAYAVYLKNSINSGYYIRKITLKPSCAAKTPGNISKGALVSGSLTLNAAGTAASGDTWYWQTAEDGEDKTNSGSSFNVSATGTYYVRSYNTSADCWSDAKSFEVKATDLVANYTVIYKDGATELDRETVEVGNAPAGITAPTKDCYTFAGWDPALNTVSGSNGDEVVVNATWTPNYAFGAYSFVNVAEVGTAPNKLTMSDGNTVNVPAGSRVDNFYFSAMAIKYESGASTALNDYKGWKINTKDATIKFLVENNCQVKVAIGSKDAINVTYTEPDGTAKNAINQGQQTEVSYLAKAGTLFTIKTATSNTTTLKRITISSLYNATYTDEKGDASGSDENVTEVTLPTPSETTVGGYSFTGWVANQTVYDGETPKTAGEALTAGGTYALTATTTFTAQWALIADFDVKFFQGYGDPDVQIGETQSISTGGHAVAPADPTRTGFAFLGWSTDGTEANIVDVATYAISAATNFTAMWKAVWTVTFDGAGNVIVEDGEAVASPDSPTQAGKVFQGWYNGESKYDFSAAVTGNLALTSKWADADPNHYVYAYNDDFHFDGVVYKTPEGKVDGGSGTSNIAMTTPYTLFAGAEGITSVVMTSGIYDSKTGAIQAVTALMKVNNNATSKLTVTIKSGYTATLKIKSSGYSATRTINVSDATPASGTTTGQAVTSGAMSVSGIGELSFALNSGSHDLTVTGGTLYIAELDIEATALPTHTVTYLPGDGEGEEVVDDDATEVADCPSTFTAPEGKIFNGWKDGDNNDVEVGTIVTGDMTLTAQWINHYAVTFNMNGHGDAPAAQDIKHGEKATKPADPVVIGWDFGGWFTDAACTAGNEFDFNTAITEAKELFAKWTEFDGCVLLVPATSGDALTVGAMVDLQAGSVGGSIKVANLGAEGSISYNANGLLLSNGGKDSILVTLNNELKNGSVIKVRLMANGGTKDNGRGLNLLNAARVKKALLGWQANEEVTLGDVGEFTYTVVESDGFAGTNVFTLQRQNSVFLQSIKVENCGAAITYHNLTSEVNIAGKGTVTLGASSVREGYTTTATYSEIDPLYEFVNWTVSGAGASIADASANPATITMGTEDAVVTLNLRLIPVKFTVEYYDGATLMGSEQVAVNENPTASEIVTAKRHYTFLGWSDTDGGDVVALNTITRTEAGTVKLYAKYEAVVCPTSGTIFSMEFDETKKPGETVTIAKNASIDLAEYATISGGNAMIINGETSGKDAISTDGEFLLKATKEVMKIELNCVLQEGDIIRIPDNSAKLVISTSNAKTGTYQAFADKNTHEFAVTAAWAGVDDIYVLYDGSSLKFTKVYVIRPAKYDVSFNMMGHGSAIADLEDVVEGSKIAAPSPSPTDADYSFAGWYKENTLENEWDFDVDVVNDNITLYAKWLDKSDATLKSLKYGSTEIELQAGVYTYAVELPSLTTSVPALTAETSNPNASAVITNADAFDGEGNATSTVEVTPEKEGAAHRTYTVNFTKLPSMPLLDVDNSIVWDFDNAGTQNNAFTDEVLANFPGVTNDATFSAQTLKASGAKIKDGYLQGTPILFHATKAGLLRVEFANTGGSARPYRYLVVNGVRTAYKSNNTAHVTTAWIEVPAGDVTIEGECVEDANGACTSDNLNFYKIEFFALGHSRDVTPGDLGTVCLPNACIARGVDVYELVGKEATYGKIVFADLEPDDLLVAGKAYIFQVNEATARFYYAPGEPVDAPLNDDSALKGNLGETITFQPNSSEAENVYFVKDHALWSAKETGVKIGQYRAYLQMDAVSNLANQSPAPGRRYIMLGTNGQNQAQGIDDVQDDVRSTKMLIDGRLFILRGEKIYDATGRLVK